MIYFSTPNVKEFSKLKYVKYYVIYKINPSMLYTMGYNTVDFWLYRNI